MAARSRDRLTLCFANVIIYFASKRNLRNAALYLRQMFTGRLLSWIYWCCFELVKIPTESPQKFWPMFSLYTTSVLTEWQNRRNATVKRGGTRLVGKKHWACSTAHRSNRPDHWGRLR